MFRARSWMSVACLGFVAASISTCAFAAHGGNGGNGGKRFIQNNAAGHVKPVGWAQGIAAAATEAKTNSVPFLIFFCSEEVAEFAGAGSKAVEKYSKTVTKMPPDTVFEAKNVVETLDALDYPIAKVALSPQTAELAKKYRVTQIPALVACEPGGEIMAGLQGDQVTQANVLDLLKSLKETYANWKKANAEKTAAKQPDAATPKAPPPDAKKTTLPDNAP